MNFRPDITINQIFRTPSPSPAASPMPAVLVGIQRQMVFKGSAGTYLGGQANSYDFPDLVAGSAVESDEHTDTFLHPRVYISNEFGDAEVTDDVTFENLNSSIAVPTFEIATNAEATFAVASGSLGNYSSTTGSFTDASADFIAGQIGAGDTIKLSGVDAFSVTSLVSDSELAVTRINHGPDDARVELSAKDSQGARVLTYTGTLEERFDGFVAQGVKVGDAVTFNGWEEHTATGGLSFTATASDERTLTATGQFTNAAIGDIVVVRDDESELEPAFHLKTITSNNVAVAANIRGTLQDSLVAGSSGYPVKYFEIKRPTTRRVIGAASATKLSTGFFSEQDPTQVRTFTDLNGVFGAVQANDVVMVYAADSGVLANIVITGTNTITRADGGSWLTDGFEAGMTVLIASCDTGGGTANLLELTIDTVSATVIVVEESTLTNDADADSVRIISADVMPLFVVISVDSGTTLTVSDYAKGVNLTTAVGGPLVYSIYSFTNVTLPSTVGANVSFEGTIQVAERRVIQWRTAFTSVTVPEVGSTVFNDSGILLFEVTDAAVSVPANTTNLNFSSAADTITRTAGSWVTDGYAVGDFIEVVGSENTGENDGIFKITVLTATVITVETAAYSGTGPAYTAGIPATNATDTAATVQKLIVMDHASAGFDLPDDDLINGIFLSIRNDNSSAYEVIRVNSETSITVRHEVTGDEVTNAVVMGLITSITVPDSITNSSYTIDKTLTGAALSGDVLISYAAIRNDSLTEMREVNQGTAESIAGPAVPGNPLGFAAAAASSLGVPVFVVQVGAETAAAWASAREVLSTDSVYNIAPLTQDETQLGLFRAHVETLSQPEHKSERILWQSHRFDSVVTRYTMPLTDSAVIKYPASVQTLEVTRVGGLTELGVIVGDVVTATYNGYIPAQGFVTGSMTARILSILESGSLTTLTLLPDTTMPATLAGGVSLTALVITSRTYTTTALKAAIAAYPGTIASRRVRNVYPDSALVSFSDTTNSADLSTGIYGGGTVTSYTIGGWFMAALIAAQRSSLPASTPLTNRPISGVRRLITPFRSTSDVDTLIDAGNYVLQQASENASITAIRALTTLITSLDFAEESVTVQIDSFARRLRRQIRPLLGSAVLDEAFFDLFSVNQAAVVDDIVNVRRELRSARLVELRESDTRADAFYASYQVRAYFSASQAEIDIYV